MKNEQNQIPMASFRPPPDWKPIVDRKEVTRQDGTIDYLLLVKKVDALGIILQKQARLIKRMYGVG